MSYGTITPELAAWMNERSDPAYKRTVPKITFTGAGTKHGLRGAGKDREFAWLVAEYQYGVLETVDLRTLKQPAVDLAAFIAAKTDPAWRPKVARRARNSGLRTMTATARRDEIGRIAAYVARYQPAK